ncbi:hypothetical protein PYCC9005_000721 [Savitreella phatthalungensis]
MCTSSSPDEAVRLPSNVKPTHYNLHLYNLDLTKFEYDGKVEIDLDISADTNTIKLNAIEIDVKVASFSTSQLKTDTAAVATDISYDEKQEEVTLTFGETIKAGSKGTLAIVFRGLINHNMHGFYRSEYTDVGSSEVKHQFSTQFESTDARRAFPCFDEPALKATFDFSLTYPRGLIAISNMPIKQVGPATVESSTAGSEGKLELSAISEPLEKADFERSPVMATYLLAWALGEFEYIESQTKVSEHHGQKIKVRVYTTKGRKSGGQLALDHACDFLDLYEKTFKIAYPLPKLDMLAVHEFSAGAMENWGLVTYRNVTILYEEGRTDAKYKRVVSYVVAHELAHQWFGNLVTFDWWRDLWLNEGFATWVGWYAVDALHPDWDVWSYFTSSAQQVALGLDSVRSSHPVEVPVRNALDVGQIFDHISYLKGASVIRMLEGFVGAEKFLEGVSQYLQKFAYGNATTQDLFESLSKVAGFDVNALISPWILKQGYPVLTVAEEIDGVGLKQERYLSTGDVKTEEDETVWTVPINLKLADGTTAARLDSKQTTLRGVDLEYYKINPDQTGFYRVNYPPERLQKFGQVAATSKDKLGATDRIGLIGDAASLAISGHGSTAALLNFVSNLSEEDSALVWEELATRVSTIRSVFSDLGDDVANGLKAFGRSIYSKKAAELGWDYPEGESYLTGQMRTLLIGVAGACDDPSIVKEARHRFDRYKSGDKQAFHPSLLSKVLVNVLSHGGSADDFDFIKSVGISNTASDDELEAALLAMGSTRDPKLIDRALDILLSTEVKAQNVHYLVAALAMNPAGRWPLWEFVQRNWNQIQAGPLGKNQMTFSRLVTAAIASFSSYKAADEIDAFFKDKDTSAFDRNLAQQLDKIRGNAAYVERDGAIVKEWLHAKGF